MSDRDPRPMPPEVLRAYRDPVDLRGLLMSSVYSEQDRRDVLDALVRSLIARHGDVWIVAGSREVRVSTRVKQTKKNVVNAIGLLSSIVEYDGSDGVLPLLAQAMQPRWAEWWHSLGWRGSSDVFNNWRDVSKCVLGPRQFAWLTAQYARTVIDLTMRYRDVALTAIEAAEAWALVPSEANRQAAETAESAVVAARAAAEAGDAYAAYALDMTNTSADVAASAARSASYAADRHIVAAHSAALAVGHAAVAAAINATAAARAANAYTFDTYANNIAEAYGSLAELTKRLITPTLVTSASGAVHSIWRR